MKKTKTNLWAALPFAIVLCSVILAQFVPDNATEEPPSQTSRASNQ